MQEAVRLMERQQRDELPRTFLELRTSSRSVVHKIALTCMEEGGAYPQSIWIVYLNETVRSVTRKERRREEQKRENTTQYVFEA